MVDVFPEGPPVRHVAYESIALNIFEIKRLWRCAEKVDQKRYETWAPKIFWNKFWIGFDFETFWSIVCHIWIFLLHGFYINFVETLLATVKIFQNWTLSCWHQIVVLTHGFLTRELKILKSFRNLNRHQLQLNLDHEFQNLEQNKNWNTLPTEDKIAVTTSTKFNFNDGANVGWRSVFPSSLAIHLRRTNHKPAAKTPPSHPKPIWKPCWNILWWRNQFVSILFSKWYGSYSKSCWGSWKRNVHVQINTAPIKFVRVDNLSQKYFWRSKITRNRKCFCNLWQTTAVAKLNPHPPKLITQFLIPIVPIFNFFDGLYDTATRLR